MEFDAKLSQVKNEQNLLQDKIKKICEFNSLLSSVLWDGDKKSIKKLEALIETKTNLGFTKEEFIQGSFLDTFLQANLWK